MNCSKVCPEDEHQNRDDHNAWDVTKRVRGLLAEGTSVRPKGDQFYNTLPTYLSSVLRVWFAPIPLQLKGVQCFINGLTGTANIASADVASASYGYEWSQKRDMSDPVSHARLVFSSALFVK